MKDNKQVFDKDFSVSRIHTSACVCEGRELTTSRGVYDMAMNKRSGLDTHEIRYAVRWGWRKYRLKRRISGTLGVYIFSGVPIGGTAT